MLASASSKSSRAPVLAKYDVLDELGHGGMATVYRAHDKRLSRDVAIKVLHPHLRESREIAHRFGVEAKAVAKLRHPNIVEVFDVSSEEDPEQFLVVELVRGPTLRKILQDQGAIPPEVAAAIVMELLAGIAHAHASGVVHRDVKPENVLVEHRPGSSPTSGKPPSVPVSITTTRGDRVAVKLTDFGIAKLLDAQGVTSTGQVLGSPAHMAPEQIEGGDVDGRADVFGLGVLLYECMVGHLPFTGNNPAQVLRRVLDGIYAPAERERPAIGKVWSQIIDRALARKPEARYPDAASMRDAIGVELARLGTGAPRVEIEAWLDDPKGWSATHDKHLIERLCALGSAARKQGDAVAAAADYNRALAYAPHNPSLLRVVASMQRSEARMRLVRRVGPLVLGAAVLGPSAYFIAKALKNPTVVEHPKPLASEPSANVTGSVASARPPPSALTTGVPVSSTAAPVRTIATPTVAPPKSVTRTLTFNTLRPSFGVHMTIDGAPAPDPVQSATFTLDEKAHTLVFTCAGDLCPSQTYPIPAGETNLPLDVALSIAPAKLVVEGDATHTYGITELPQLTIASGEDVSVPIVNGGQRTIHVFDRNDSSRASQEVTVTTGKRTPVSFKGR